MPKPQALVAPTTTKLKNVGMSDHINQYNMLGQQQNASQYSSSDAKLNAAQRTAQNEQVLNAQSRIGQDLARQNQGIDQANASLFSQDANTRASVAAQNAAQDHQYRTQQNLYKQGLIRSNGASIDQYLSEEQHKRDQKQNQLDALSAQDYQTALNKAYGDKLEAHDLKYKGGKTDAEWTQEMINDPIRAARYKREREALIAERAKDWRDYQKKSLTGVYQKGGSLEEKKELIAYKEEMKRIADADKAFNKQVLEKMKNHQKILSLLSK